VTHEGKLVSILEKQPDGTWKSKLHTWNNEPQFNHRTQTIGRGGALLRRSRPSAQGIAFEMQPVAHGIAAMVSTLGGALRSTCPVQWLQYRSRGVCGMRYGRHREKGLKDHG
jgi:hypothetical protein